MALINKITWEVADHIDVDAEHKDWFECDELIAHTIAELNKKGYTTNFCCSGHLHRGWVIGRLLDGSYKRLACTPSETYISFSETLEFKKLPPDFYWENGHILEKEHDYGDGYSLSFMRQLLATAEDLEEWVNALPQKREESTRVDHE